MYTNNNVCVDLLPYAHSWMLAFWALTWFIPVRYDEHEGISDGVQIHTCLPIARVPKREMPKNHRMFFKDSTNQFQSKHLWKKIKYVKKTKIPIQALPTTTTTITNNQQQNRMRFNINRLKSYKSNSEPAVLLSQN